MVLWFPVGNANLVAQPLLHWLSYLALRHLVLQCKQKGALEETFVVPEQSSVSGVEVSLTEVL
jgi:hypothetical protein